MIFNNIQVTYKENKSDQRTILKEGNEKDFNEKILLSLKYLRRHVSHKNIKNNK